MDTTFEDFFGAPPSRIYVPEDVAGWVERAKRPVDWFRDKVIGREAEIALAIAHRATTTVSGANSGNVTVAALPTGHVANDILLLLTAQFDSVAATVSGYTQIAVVSFGTTCRGALFAKRDGGSETAPTVTHSAGGTIAVIMSAYSGVSTSLTIGSGTAGTTIFRGGFAGSSGTGTGANIATSGQGVTDGVSGDMRLFYCIETGSDTSGAASANFAPPSGFTERSDTGRVGASSHAMITLDDLLATGTPGSITATCNGTGAAGTCTWSSVQMALSSATGGTSVSDIIRNQLARTPLRSMIVR